jgi:hypothetical protein
MFHFPPRWPSEGHVHPTPAQSAQNRTKPHFAHIWSHSSRVWGCKPPAKARGGTSAPRLPGAASSGEAAAPSPAPRAKTTRQ